MATRACAALGERPVIWEPQPGPQTALLACPIFEVFFGGARGGGKTDGMLGEWVSHQDLHGPRAAGLMVRRTIRDLEDTIKRSRAIYLALGARFLEQEKVWKFPSGAEIKFRYLERDADAEHYQGHSYTRVYVEELGQFPSPDPVNKLMATLRSGTGVPCGFRATGNPGGPGHQWVKARYIDGAPTGWKVTTTEFKNPWTSETITRDRVFIPSRLRDNRYLGGEYVATLQMAGSAQLVRAWLEGDWSIIDGAFFSEWSDAQHIIAPFTIPDEWTRFRSADWGSAKPFSIGWWAVSSDDIRLDGKLVPRGALIRYREYYGASKPNVGLKLPAETVAERIIDIERQEVRRDDGSYGMPKHVSYSVMDPAAFSSDGGPSIAERFADKRVYFSRADNARVPGKGAMGGWDQLRMRLIGTAQLTDSGVVDWSTGHPMIYFFSTCAAAIRTIPALQHDKSRAEDVDTEQEDHAADETRYACMSRPYARSKDVVKPLRGAQDMTMAEAWKHAMPKTATDRRI